MGKEKRKGVITLQQKAAISGGSGSQGQDWKGKGEESGKMGE
jgi:hypothetical protein